MIGHALQNALIPVVTIVGASLPVMVGGAVIIEQIFALPGLGRLMPDALTRRDYLLVSGINLVIADRGGAGEPAGGPLLRLAWCGRNRSAWWGRRSSPCCWYARSSPTC